MAFRMDKLTVKAQEAVQRAQESAVDHHHQRLLPLHILHALVEEEQGTVRPIIQKIGANVGQLNQMVEGELKRIPQPARAKHDRRYAQPRRTNGDRCGARCIA